MCLGITIVKNNEITQCLSYLINPEQPFRSINTQIHGISKADVAEASIFPGVWQEIKHLFRHYPVVAHGASFEKSVLEKTALRYKFNLPTITYYDTLYLAQENYPMLGSYELKSICRDLGIEMGCHHQCDADSDAAAKIMIKMVENEEFVIYPWAIGASYDPIDEVLVEEGYNYNNPSRTPEFVEAKVEYDAVAELVFEKSRFVLTGDIEGFTRGEIENMITSRGGNVVGSVSKKTNYLIIGKQDISVVSDQENAKSGKIRKAEELRATGCDIKFIRGEDFVALYNVNFSA